MPSLAALLTSPAPAAAECQGLETTAQQRSGSVQCPGPAMLTGDLMLWCVSWELSSKSFPSSPVLGIMLDVASPRLPHQTGVLLLGGFSPQAQPSTGQTKKGPKAT